MTPAEWDGNKISTMSEEHNLRNLCRQLEQQYVDWNRDATYDGFRICMEWPAIGELGRYLVDGVRVRFVTTHKRTIEVQLPNGMPVEEFSMVPGLAEALYVCAGGVITHEPQDDCRPDGSPLTFASNLCKCGHYADRHRVKSPQRCGAHACHCYSFQSADKATMKRTPGKDQSFHHGITQSNIFEAK